MNVTGTEPQACAPAGAATVARDANGNNPATAADAAAFFLDLLAQATTAPAAALPALPSPLPAAGPQDEGDPTDTGAPVDWVLPFLPPLPGASPPSLDLELPVTGPSDDPMAAVAAESDDNPVTPLPVLVDDVRVSKDPASLVAPDPARTADATGSAPVAPAAPRVEGAGSGGAQAVVRHVTVPVHDGRWPEQIGHEVRILVERGVQAATLRLTPEHLGPVDVRIDIVNDKANVVFGAAQADTRAALGEAIPRLREMFAGAGLTLGDAGVRQDLPGQFSGSGPHQSRAGAGSDPFDAEPAAAVHVAHIGLVDAYA